MLINILYRVMNEHGVKYNPLADSRNTEFLFSISQDEKDIYQNKNIQYFWNT